MFYYMFYFTCDRSLNQSELEHHAETLNHHPRTSPLLPFSNLSAMSTINEALKIPRYSNGSGVIALTDRQTDRHTNRHC